MGNDLDFDLHLEKKKVIDFGQLDFFHLMINFVTPRFVVEIGKMKKKKKAKEIVPW